MSDKKVVAVNTVSQLMGKMVSGAVTFVISLLLARNLGASGYGDFTKITTYIAVFYLFTDFGLNAIYLKDAQTNPDNPKTWQQLIAIRILIGVIAMMAALSIMAFLPGGIDGGYSNAVKIGIILFCPTIFFQGLINTANAIFQKNLRYDLATFATVAGSIASLVLIWISTRIFLPSAAVFGGIVSLVIGSFFTLIGAYILSHKLVKWELNFDIKGMQSLFINAIPLGLTLICNVIYFRADNFILTLTRSTNEVGLYGLAYKMFEFVLVVPTFFMNSVYPLMLTKMHHADGIKNYELKQLQKKSLLFLVPAALLIMLCLWFLAPFLSLIKPEFAGSILALRILSLGIPFFFLSSLTMWTLIALNQQKILLVIYLVSMVFNIAMNLIFIPTYGYMAAAWITGISEVIVLVLSVSVLHLHLASLNKI
jgi:O-antigen/teichoic acid export membrane protein